MWPPRSFRTGRCCRPSTRRWYWGSNFGSLSGLWERARVWVLADRHRRRLEHPHGPATHPVAAPAEDDGVNATRQDAWDQSLTFPTMKEPADNEAHRADETYHLVPDNSTPKPLRL